MAGELSSLTTREVVVVDGEEAVVVLVVQI